MKKKHIEFYYDFGSPNAFLVHSIIEKIENKTGYKTKYIPVLLGGIFKLTNNIAPYIAYKNVKNKLEYQSIEFNRFVKKHAIKFNHNIHFPLRTVELMRAAVFFEGRRDYKKFINTIFKHSWSEPKKLDDLKILQEVLENNNFSFSEIFKAINSQKIKNKLKENTNLAVEKGIFGTPSFIIKNQLFFGKDSICDLEDYLLSIK